MPAQQGAPDGTLPPCGVRTFPPPCGIRKRPGGAFSRKAVADLFGQAMNGERKNGFPKGRECALKYAAGLRTRGERRYAIFERTVNDMPVAYRLAMEENRRLSILWFSVPFLKEPFVLLLRGTLWNQKMPLWGVFPQGCGRLARPSHERRTGCSTSRHGKNASGVFHERALRAKESCSLRRALKINF